MYQRQNIFRNKDVHAGLFSQCWAHSDTHKTNDVNLIENYQAQYTIGHPTAIILGYIAIDIFDTVWGILFEIFVLLINQLLDVSGY